MLEQRLPPGDLLSLATGSGDRWFAPDPGAPTPTAKLALVQNPRPSRSPLGLPRRRPTSPATTKNNVETAPPPAPEQDDAFPATPPAPALAASLLNNEGPNLGKQGGGAPAAQAQAGANSAESGPLPLRGAGSDGGDVVPPAEPALPANPVQVTNVRDQYGHKGLTLLTRDARPTIVGTAPAGRLVRIHDNGRFLGLAQVNRFGTFAFRAPTRLANGLHNFRASLAYTPGLGEIQASIRIDTKAPGVFLSMTDFVRKGETATGFVNVNDTDGLGFLESVHLDFDLNGDTRYTPEELNTLVFTGSDFTLPELPDGVYKVRARVHDEVGNFGAAYATITYDSQAGVIGSDVLRGLGGIEDLSKPDVNKGEVVVQSEPEAGQPTLQLKDVEEDYYTAYNSIRVEARYTTPAHAGEFRAALEEMGFVYEGETPESNLIAGYLPIDKIKDLPSIPWFVAATPVSKPKTKAGSVTSAGDGIIGGPAFRAANNVTGAGVRVGVISDSVNRFGGGLPQSIASGNLPPNVLVLRDGAAGDSDEGRAMLEIVHDVAPGSPLAFHTADFGPTVFTRGIYALARAGARVITDDIGYANSPLFNSGRMGRAVDDVSKRGVVYTTAAGNEGDFGYRGTWNPLQATVAGVRGTFMRFSVDALQRFLLPANATIDIVFGWDSPYLEGGDPAPRFQVPNDLDFFLIDPATNAILASSRTVNQATDEATERIVFTNGNQPRSLAFAFQLFSGPAPRRIGWVSFGSSVTTIGAEGEGATTMIGQVLAAKAITTAAADAASGANTVESFSAFGGQIDINADDQGRRYPVPQLIMKPEVTAPDNVQTSFFVPPGVGTPARFFFPGTSAAAPHVAGAAALLLQQQPRATNLNVREHLILTARDLGPRGFDPRAGYGLINLQPIVSGVPAFAGQLEPNNTSLQAVTLGPIGRPVFTLLGVSIRYSHLGLPDYDWYSFTAAKAGLLAVKLDNQNLALQLFLPVGPFLQEVYNGTPLAAGQKVYVEVKGRLIGPNRYTEAATGCSCRCSEQDGGAAPGAPPPLLLRVRLARFRIHSPVYPTRERSLPMTASAAIQLEVRDGVAVATLDQPGGRANTLGQAVLGEFEQLLGTLRQRSDVKGLVLRSGKPGMFIAGADLKELGGARPDPEQSRKVVKRGLDIVAGFEALPFPTVAAIDGSCMGGGLELAMGCDYRLASNHPKTELGLPEVKIGLFPGWGGTQRLTRLVGPNIAAEMITTGEPAKADRARQIGLVWDVVPAERLLDEAIALVKWAATDGGWKEARKRKQQPVGLTEEQASFAFAVAKGQVLAKTGGQYPAPLAAVEAIYKGCNLPLEEGLKVETDRFVPLVGSPVAKALIGVFFQTQRLAKETGSADPSVKAKEVRQVGVIGAGIMGAGIAGAHVRRGVPAAMLDSAPAQLEKGIGNITKSLMGRVQIGRMTAAEAATSLAMLSTSMTNLALADRDVVIEAIVENEEAKVKLYGELEKVLRPGAILASNTSTISITRMAKSLRDPSRFAGLHFFNPVDRMQLVEVIRGEKTSEETVVTLVALARKISKTPIVVKDCPGFLVNRILFPYMNEAMLLLEEGVPPRTLDKAATAFGMPMGPVTLQDVVGLDTSLYAGRVVNTAFADRAVPTRILDDLVAAGRLGQKTGAGFFSYAKGARGADDPALAGFLAKVKRPGNPEMKAEEIQDRLFLPMLTEATRVLAEGIVRDPGDVDMGLLLGIGFPSFRGGILRWADTMGIGRVMDKLAKYESLGSRFQPTEMLKKMAAEGRGFYPG
ncbi:MAG: 3-hydroxyacyl-CoA dehydrogenase NAD-binding domain-containing protein [Gemmataceae bacterium]